MFELFDFELFYLGFDFDLLLEVRQVKNIFAL